MPLRFQFRFLSTFLTVSVMILMIASSGMSCSGVYQHNGRMSVRHGWDDPRPRLYLDLEDLRKRSDDSSSLDLEDVETKKYEANYKIFFNRLDTNNDGVVDYDEGLNYFLTLDNNHDGEIDEGEFNHINSA